MKKLFLFFTVIIICFINISSCENQIENDSKFVTQLLRYFQTRTLSSNQLSATTCAGCAVVIHFLVEVAKFREIPISEAMEYICHILPKPEQQVCELYVLKFGEIIIELFEEFESPDLICQKIDFCTGDMKKCFAYKDLYYKDLQKSGWNIYEVEVNPQHNTIDPTFDLSQETRDLFNGKFGGSWDPIPKCDDHDKDYFSTYFGLRGTAWRGRDCNDNDENIYPGRKTFDPKNAESDYSCNGIFGRSNDSITYQEKFCSGDNAPRGIAVMGDSVCSHFRIPPQLISPNVNISTYLYAPEIGENELDWPFLSMYMGYREDFTGLTPGNVSSIYQYMRDRNRCVHRDFQNICVNGARSSVLHYLASFLNRDVNDNPITIFVNLVGDDVCSSHPGSYTKPDDFYAHLMETYEMLDKKLPKDSYIVMLGFVDGRCLYNLLHDQIHPIGSTYKAVYDYLNCLNISMCVGWCNSDEKMRNMTTEAAEKLNVMSRKIVSEQNFKNIKLHWIPFDQEVLFKELERRGHSRVEAIEPMDGFHPSQISQSIFADYLISETLKVFPDAFGNVNPYNEEIEKIFGDQGGY